MEQEIRDRLAAVSLTVGLGLCWASEELVMFCVAGLSTGHGSTYLYADYLPLLAVAGTVLAFGPGIARAFSSGFSRTMVLAMGVLGVLLFGLFPDQAVAVACGIALYVAGVAATNVLWMRALACATAQKARGAVVATAFVTTAALVFWPLGDRGALLAAALLFSLSLGAYGLWALRGGQIEPAVEGVPVSDGWALRRWAAPLGVCAIMMSFGFLQYGSYRYDVAEPLWREGVSHLLAAALLATAVYGSRDGEYATGFKIATTLMLFSFVARAALPSWGVVSVGLAAATEGMLELLALLVLVEFVKARRLEPIRVFGCYLVAVSVTQLVGCELSVVEHSVAPSSSYSAVGLAFVALLIIAAVWLLNDKTVTAFLWEGREESGRREDTARPTSEQPFDERARAVAAAFGLTARETEVMQLFAKGRSSSFIAESFCVSNNTVRSHILHLYAKCDVHSRQELITLIDDWEPERK